MITPISRSLLLLFLLLPRLHAAGDWVELFDGKTTTGWTPRSTVESFEAKGGELHLLTKINCWFTTDIQRSDSEAELEILLPADSEFNSGFRGQSTGPSYHCKASAALR